MSDEKEKLRTDVEDGGLKLKAPDGKPSTPHPDDPKTGEDPSEQPS